MECGVEDALIRASRTVVETYKREPLVNHQTRKEKKRERENLRRSQKNEGILLGRRRSRR